MKKLCVVAAIIALLTFSLVSCRNYNADDGMYGYYNNRTTDREYNERTNNARTGNVPENAKNRIKNSYNKAKENVKDTFDNATEYIGNAMGVR